MFQIGQAGVEGGGDGGHPFDHLVEELPAHYRRLSKHPSSVALEPVDPGRDDAPHRCRHLGAVQRAFDPPALATCRQGPGLDQGVDDLLDEEGVAIGTVDDKANHLARRVVDLQQGGEQLACLTRRQGSELDLTDTCECAFEGGAVVGDHHRRDGDRGDETIDDGDGRGVHPVEVLEDEHRGCSRAERVDHCHKRLEEAVLKGVLVQGSVFALGEPV
jgi:hypothetical protein